MFLPLHDNTPLRIIRFRAVTGLLIVINLLVFLATHYAVGGQGEVAIAFAYGATPAHLASTDIGLPMVPDYATLITYTFLHAGWLHLLSNMAFVWVFADNVEDAFGHLGFLAFYIVCGAAAGIAHALADPTSLAPLIGASGAVAGILAAYLVLFPNARIWILLFLRIPLRISAAWALLAWFAFQLVSVWLDPGDGDVAVAWWAHIGGFLAGLLITWLLRERLRLRLAA